MTEILHLTGALKFLDGIALLIAHKWKDTYFILQNKYLCINEDSFGAKIMHNATNSKKFRVVYAAAAVINEVVPNF